MKIIIASAILAIFIIYRIGWFNGFKAGYKTGWDDSKTIDKEGREIGVKMTNNP